MAGATGWICRQTLIVGLVWLLPWPCAGQEAAPATLPEAPSVSWSAAPPRMEGADVVVDGRLDEVAWSRAAVLRGFSQYLPNDNRPADDSTRVLVWYSPHAIYFGIRAYQDSSTVRATLADRDKISDDDYVAVLLDTYDDHRQAFLFAVNPLGVQGDGTLQDAERHNIDLTSSAVVGAYAVDVGPDFVYQSKGRQTGWGYEVELRIPFRTLRYLAADSQEWGVNVLRKVQRSGHLQTWTRVLQTDASFLAQSGTLTGLTHLQRGLVLDVTPEATTSVAGGAGPAGWHYGGASSRVGATVRWGVTPNLTLDGTVRPDFSQVEADVPQVQPDPRVAVSYPEKRPFFLDGLELFKTPVPLIYTRRLVDPQGAVKLTGKVGATTVAFLSGVDGVESSATGRDHPVMSVLRARRDVGGRNSVGIVYTDRVDGTAFNRVAAVDGVLKPGGAWAFTFQGGGSATRDSATAPIEWAPMWRVSGVRSGRRFGLTLLSYATGDDFQAASGFVSRRGAVANGIIPSYTWVGTPGSLLESTTANVYLAGTWHRFEDFTAGALPDDRQADFSAGFTLRGGWQLGTGVSVESFGYPPSLYAGYWVERVHGATADTVAFVGEPRIPNLDFGLNVSTPRFQSFSLTAWALTGRDENFYEWASGRIVFGGLDLMWRPTDQLRAEIIYNHQETDHRRGGGNVALLREPQLRLAYQLSRPLFFRVIAGYESRRIAALRDDGRTNGAILFRDPATGSFSRSTRSVSNTLRIDWLLSYRPVPGTVLFIGYGSSLADGAPFRFHGLSRSADGFFVKLSYLFRS